MIRRSLIGLMLAMIPAAVSAQAQYMEAVCSILQPGTSVTINQYKFSLAADGIGCSVFNLRAVNDLCRSGRGQDLDCAQAAREEAEHGR